VLCDDPLTSTWLQGWVDTLRLSPPEPLSISVRVVRGQLDEDGDQRTPFCQPYVEIRGGPPQGDLRIRWLVGPAHGTIGFGSRVAEVVLGPDALADRERLVQTFLTTVLLFLLRRAGWHHVHAATARDPRGRDWLFAGNAQAGKSTTAAYLATCGWGVGGDDATYLARKGERVEAVAQRSTIALRPGGYELLGLSGGTSARGGRKTAFYPEELGGEWLPRVTPEILILPKVEGATTRAEPVRPREALVELVRWSAWVALEPALAQEHLDMLNALARQARCYRLFLGPDLFTRHDLLLELVQ